MTLASPLVLFGLFLLLWVWMSRRPEHPLTQAFYRRFRPVRVRTPPGNVLSAVTGWGVTEIALGVVIATVNPEPLVAFLVAVGSIALGGLATLVVAVD